MTKQQKEENLEDEEENEEEDDFVYLVDLSNISTFPASSTISIGQKVFFVCVLLIERR